MPVILILWIVNFYINYFYEGIKSYVIFFSIIIYINIIYLLSLFYSNSQVKPNNNVLQFSRYSLLRSRAASIKNILLRSKRNYSTLKGSGALCTKNKPKRKTLSSPESRPYTDLYEGRGTPKNEPVWVKDNGKERSPFGASWAKDGKDRLLYPTNYTCNYINILDPYNNRKLIKETCKGNRVVYIWTYIVKYCMPIIFYYNNKCVISNTNSNNEKVFSRSYSTLSGSSLSPWFITGFTDAEGSFTLSILKDNSYKTGWQVRLFFEIRLHKKDRALLEEFITFFGVGKIYAKNNDAVSYLVSSSPAPLSS